MTEITEKIESLLTPLLEGSDIFLISIRIKPTNNIKVFLDADSGLSIQKIASVNRKLYAAIEAEGLFPEGDFSLEVSSPGVDEPLTQPRQYRKNIGRTVEVTPLEGKEITGILREAGDEKLVLEVKTGKKKETSLVEIPLATIKTTVVQIIF